MASIEDILRQRAAQDAQERQESQQLGGTLGAIGGSVLGVAGGAVPHTVGNLLRPKAVKEGLGILSAGRPGFRMAGGLVGALLGGVAGAGMANTVKNSSPAGELLAKIQATGELSVQDQMALETILADSYNKGPGMN